MSEKPKQTGTQSGPTGPEGRPIKGDPEIPYNPDVPHTEAREEYSPVERSDTRTPDQDELGQRADEDRLRHQDTKPLTREESKEVDARAGGSTADAKKLADEKEQENAAS